MRTKINLLLIGPCPPPLGGVSVHIQRLHHLLSDAFFVNLIDDSSKKKVGIINIRKFNLLGYLMSIYRADIIHIHSGHYLLRFFHFTWSNMFFKKTVLTIHSYSEKNKGFLEKRIDNLVVKLCDRVVFVSKEITDKFKRKDYFIREAFIPEIPNDKNKLPLNITAWINEKIDAGYKICCANAWRLEKYLGEDLYGLDLCIKAAQILKSHNQKFAFIFVVCDLNGAINVNTYKEQIASYGLSGSFLIYESSLSFINLIEKSDIVLRPTNTDGDALTIREGLFLKKSVIASDVVSRPLGTILFKNRCPISLAETIGSSTNQSRLGENCDYTSQINNFRSFYQDTLYNF